VADSGGPPAMGRLAGGASPPHGRPHLCRTSHCTATRLSVCLCVSGGTRITLTGSDMDVAIHPSLHVTVYIQRVVKRRRGDDQEINFSHIISRTVRTHNHPYKAWSSILLAVSPA